MHEKAIIYVHKWKVAIGWIDEVKVTSAIFVIKLIIIATDWLTTR